MEHLRLERMMDVINARQADITLVLENVFDPHNISAVLRTCDGVGLGSIHILNSRQPPHQHWGFRSSAGAWKWIKSVEHATVDDCIITLKDEGKRIYAAHFCDEATSIYQMDFSGSVAIVFGNEQNGCSPEILSKCDGKIFIPQVGMVKSLNVSVACAVILYEAFRQKQAAGHYNTPSLPEKVRNDLIAEWTDFSNIRKLKNRKP